MPGQPHLSEPLTLNLSGLKCKSPAGDDSCASATDISLQTTNPDCGEALSCRPSFVTTPKEANGPTQPQTQSATSNKARADEALASSCSQSEDSTAAGDTAENKSGGIPKAPSEDAATAATGDELATSRDVGNDVHGESDTEPANSTQSPCGLDERNSVGGRMTSRSLVPSPDTPETTLGHGGTVSTEDSRSESAENGKGRASLALFPQKFLQGHSPRTDLLGRPVECLVAEILDLRAQVQNYEKEVSVQRSFEKDWRSVALLSLFSVSTAVPPYWESLGKTGNSSCSFQ